MARLVIISACLLAGIAFSGALVWPGAALLIQSFGEAGGNGTQLDFGMRHLLLLGRTLALVAASTLASLIIGLAAAPAFTGLRYRFAFTVGLLVLLCPPMVYAFGWQRVLPAAVNPHLGCCMVWSLWSWPIAAMIIAGGLRGLRSSYEAALLSAGPIRAYLRIVIPALAPQILVAGLAVSVVLLGDYTTPHAFGLVVYATELLGWAASSPGVADTATASLPLLGVILAMLAALFLLLRRDALPGGDYHSELRGCRGRLAAVVGLGVLAFGIPIAALVLKLSGPKTILAAVQTYGRDLGASLAVAAAGGISAVAVSIAIAYLPRFRVPITTITVLFGVAPGALVGESLIAAYNRPGLAWVYDHWLIVAFGHSARFLWIGALAGWILARERCGNLGLQAKMDGADDFDVACYVTIPRHRAMLGGIGLTVLALSLAEVAATALIRVPGFSPISQIIIEKFHRFEDDMLISLSLLLIAAGLIGAVVLGRAVHRGS